jgi:hypothetical protein
MVGGPRWVSRIALAALGAGMCLPAAATGSFPGDPGLIAFQNDSAGGIYTIEPNGSDRTQIDDDGFEPSWSPSGRRIAFVQSAPGTFATDVYTMKADGSDRERVTRTKGSEWEPAFSHDGKRIVYRKGKFRGGAGTLYSIRTSGQDTKRLRKGEHPDWSVPVEDARDGRIVFARFATPEPCPLSTHAFAMRPTGRGLALLPFDCQTTSEPSVAPDGESIAASSRDPDAPDVNIYVVGFGDPNPVTDLAGDDREPAMSPDGVGLVFRNETAGGLYRVTTPLTETLIPNTTAVDGGQPSWQPLPG